MEQRLHLRPRLQRVALLVTALLTAAAAAFAPALTANADEITAQAVSHKSPFNCNKTFWANNWIDSPAHNPKNTIDWQSYGSDAINGENVRATAGGTAYFYNAGSTSYGLWVQIVHSDGSRTRYAHLATMVGAVGTSRTVAQGTIIGTVGSTGGSSAPHLHYEQRNASGTVVTPVIQGIQVPYGSKKAITSTNACGSTNPYTPQEVCGSGYTVIDSQAVTGGRVYLLYNSGNGYNCVTTIKSTSIGTASAVSAGLQVEGGTMTTDSGSFAYYAGPIRKYAADSCVKWGGSVGSSSYLSGFEHCG
ncbi:M23 family metallopeptidase [Glycomyces sp. NPDC021274]|uniref:M23 family metallopeptidase n=1 Tax=Glycomyces sp. NPDC021274 TaxID=3155120 RepID=UPI0033DA4A6B